MKRRRCACRETPVQRRASFCTAPPIDRGRFRPLKAAGFDNSSNKLDDALGLGVPIIFAEDAIANRHATALKVSAVHFGHPSQRLPERVLKIRGIEIKSFMEEHLIHAANAGG